MANFNKAALAITVDNSSGIGIIDWKCKLQILDGGKYETIDLTKDQFLNILEKIKTTMVEIKEKKI
jgi:hypothetical protein